jgi:hypothetical protein
MNTEIQQIAVRDLLPNPFRDIALYEIHEEKVEQLISSFKSTGVWPTIVARPASKKGQVEIAFAHHRREGLNRLYKDNLGHKINVNVTALSDEEMLKMMVAENQEEFHSSFFVTIGDVESVIKAAAEGKIQLEEVPYNNSRKIVETTTSSVRRISAPVIARFLNWVHSSGTPQRKVLLAMQALDFIQDNILTRDDFRGLNEYQAEKLLISTAAAQTAYEHREGIHAPLKELKHEESKLKSESRTTPEGKAKVEQRLAVIRKEKESFAPKIERIKAKTAKVMKAVVKEVKAGKVAATNIRDLTFKQMGEKRSFFKSVPDIDQFTTDLCRDLFKILNDPEDKERLAKIRSLAENRTDIGEKRINSVKGHLEGIAERALDLSLTLGPLPPKLVEVRRLLELRS